MLRIGLAQIHNHFEIEKNLQSIKNAIENHAKNKADLVLFPECSVTGYNTGLLKLDKEKIIQAVVEACDWAKAHKIAVALPTPWPCEGGFHNAILHLSDAGEIVQIFSKIGLHTGEERFFIPGKPHTRILKIKGYKIGVIICAETAHAAWSYLQEQDGAEMIYWPGFYAASEEDAKEPWSKSGADQKVKDNLQKYWCVPLLLLNGASSPEAQYWPGKLFGGSAVYDKEGELLYSAKRLQEELALLEFDQNNGISISCVRSSSFV